MFLRSVLASAILALPSIATAADWHHDLRVVPGASPVETATRALATVIDGRELGPARVLTTGSAITVRFDQVHRGVRVLGRTAAARVTAGGRVSTAVVDLADGLDVDPVPTLSASAAVAAAGVTEGRTSLGILPDGAGRLVWAITTPERGGLRLLVDARSGEVVHQRALRQDVLGRVYPVSPDLTPETRDVELVDLVSTDPQHLNGWEGNLQVVNYLSGDLTTGAFQAEQTLGPNAGADFLYDPPADPRDMTDGFAQVSLYHHLSRARSFYADDLGISMSGRAWALTAVANAGSGGGGLDNAFFNPGGVGAPWNTPNLIAIGQGTDLDFALDSDVFIHEFGHYVSTNAVGANEGQFATGAYGLSPWTGSIDEGIADYFACSVNDDPIVGETVLASFGAERDLRATGGRCPDDVYGEVHLDGMFIGTLGWALREAYGATAADQLVWGALALTTTTSSLGDFARGVRSVGEDMVAAGDLSDLTALDAAVAARGLDACDVVQDLPMGGSKTMYMVGLDVVAQLLGASCAQAQGLVSLHSFFHFKSEPFVDSQGLRFEVTLDPEGGGDLEWSLYLAKGRHVGFKTGFFLPEVDDYDWQSETWTTPTGSFDIPEDEYDPDAVYYGVIVHKNCPSAKAVVLADRMVPDAPVDTGDTGDTGDGETPGGCSCGVGPAAGAWLALLPVVLLAFRRRRR